MKSKHNDLSAIGEMDLHFFNEGTHRRLWEILGANCRVIEGVSGVSFAVWAPNARRVSVVGDFCQWDERKYPMHPHAESGVWEVFVPAVHVGDMYKFAIEDAAGRTFLKTDPMAKWMETPSGTAARVYSSSYTWSDEHWMRQREIRNIRRSPMATYELHLGSWARVPEENNRSLTYRELAPRLVEHVKKLGFNYIELLPVMEHPFAGSWGYQVSGYYAPSSRFGTPDDFRFFIDYCHQHGIGVILDWVPAHFPKDEFALARFDGTALYEHSDPRLGEHPDWGTYIFNYGRNEVRNFLVANALYWLKEFHADGIRVDAVASMLYLDYSRLDGEWVANAHGGRENLEAVAFLRTLNQVIAHEAPGCFTIAEESTAWPGVTAAVSQGGLGFDLKWNMGWMHDTLESFKRDPVYRKHHQHQLTFSMVYEYDEAFVMPLSHDEVVHGKGSLYSKMPGDTWQKFANLRLLYGYQFLRPGKKLLFMGSELAQVREWDHDCSVDWHLLQNEANQKLLAYMQELGSLYHQHPCLWAGDPDRENFAWIDFNDQQNSVLSFVRKYKDDTLVVVCNMTPVIRDGYRLGMPQSGVYREVFNSDDQRFGGSGCGHREVLKTDSVPMHGTVQSLVLTLPPLGILVLQS